MSTLGKTYFCKNGHEVLTVPHGNIMDDPTECPYCKSKNIMTIWEWGDPDYTGWDSVSPIPTGTEPYTINVPVYDVSELFKED